MSKKKQKRHITKNEQVKGKTKETKNQGKKKLSVLIIISAIVSLIACFAAMPTISTLIEASMSKTPFLLFAFLVPFLLFVYALTIGKKISQQIVLYVFLALLIFNLSIGLLSLLTYWNITSFELVNQLKIFQKFAIIPSVMFGGVMIIINKNKINSTINSINQKTENQIISDKNFVQKHPKISKIFCVGALSKLFHREGIKAILIFFIGLLLTMFIYGHDLGKQDLWSDEYQVVATAKGYTETGEFKKWDFIENEISETPYSRAYPHTWLIAQSYKVFGISEWSSRIVSVVFGVIFYVLFFWLLLTWFGSLEVAGLVALVVISEFYFIHLFRMTRMYSILIPLTFTTFYLFFRALTGTNKYKIINEKITKFVNKFFNFNLLYFLAALVFALFSFIIHVNSIVILIAVYLLLFYLSITTKEKKYWYNFILATIIGVITGGIYLNSLSGWTNMEITFFENRAYQYIEFLFQAPFMTNTGVILAFMSVFLMFTLTNKPLKTKLAFFLFPIAITVILFVYIIEYKGVAYRYISHIAPLVIFVVVGVYLLIMKSLYHKFIYWFALLFIVVLSIISGIQGNDRVLNDNKVFPHYSEAYKVINENAKSNDAVFGQYLRAFYLQNVMSKVKNINMLNESKYSIQQFITDLKKHKKGWITWSIPKSYHIQYPIIKFVRNFFVKHSGTGINSTNVEVYYYDSTMIPPSVIDEKSFNRAINTNVNLHMRRGETFMFWMKPEIKSAPIVIGDSLNGIRFDFIDDNLKNGISLCYRINGTEKCYKTQAINTKQGKWLHFVWQQESGKKGAKWNFYINGVKALSEQYAQNLEFSPVFGIVDLLGLSQDIRIYEYFLPENQIKQVYNNGQMLLQSVLEDGDTKYAPIHHFKFNPN